MSFSISALAWAWSFVMVHQGDQAIAICLDVEDYPPAFQDARLFTCNRTLIAD
jgi:hypothetical protein